MVRFNLKHAVAAVACTAGLVAGSVAMAGPASASSQTQTYTCGSYGTVTAELDYSPPTVSFAADVGPIIPGDLPSVSGELGYSPPIPFDTSITGGILFVDLGEVTSNPGTPPWFTMVVPDQQSPDPSDTITITCTTLVT